MPTDAESPSRRCKTGAGNMYSNGGKIWVGSFHSNFKE